MLYLGYMNFGSLFPAENPGLTFLILIWSIFWKGVALWRAARESQRNWFIAMLVLSTAGILEIIYLFKFSKRPLSLREMKRWISRKE
jgi:hypothetical protein